MNARRRSRSKACCKRIRLERQIESLGDVDGDILEVSQPSSHRTVQAKVRLELASRVMLVSVSSIVW
jgi:hypothetical protein